jgi:methyl-accepting chemotaxis protein
MKLRKQTYLLSAIILVSMLVLSFSGLWTLRMASSVDNQTRVTELFKSAYATLSQLEKLAEEGTFTDEQAKAVAQRILRNNIYKDSEYVYVADENMDFVAAPLDPQLHGTSFHDFRDHKGQSVGQLILDALESSNGSLVEYSWSQKQADGSVEEKLSIAERTPRWGWVVGTGIGFNEVNTRFWATAKWQLLLCFSIAGSIFALLVFSSRKILCILGGEPVEVQRAVQEISQGKINRDFVEKAEKGSIYESIQEMSMSLAKLVGNIDRSTKTILGELKQTQSRAGKIATLTDSQQQSTEMIATAMTEMASSANHVADSASDTAINTDNADSQSQHAQKLIQATVSNIEGLASQLSEASHALSQLDGEVNNIASVLQVIGDIAEQTNLLALNAAIEAARAGDQGRGFAVVADEVRNLAGRTQESTKEIQHRMQNLQAGSAQAIKSMQICANTSKATVSESINASSALQDVVVALESISAMGHQIATAAAQQTQVGDDISQRINMIEQSGIELRQVVTETHGATQALSTLANELSQWISRFEVK